MAGAPQRRVYTRWLVRGKPVLTRPGWREFSRAMGTTRRLDGNLHRACRTVFSVGCLLGRMSHLVDDPDDEKYCERDNQKVDHERNEVAVVPGDCSGFRGIRGSIECGRTVFGRSQNEKLVRKIQSAGQQANRRHDHIFHQ